LLDDLNSQPPASFVRVFTISKDAKEMNGLSLNAEGASYDSKTTPHSLRDAISNF
jgi:hypothetical protein